MCKLKMMCVLSAMAFHALANPASARGRLAVSAQLPSPYDDGEISTNVVFEASGPADRGFSLEMDLDASPDNSVTLSLGSDEDGDGTLAWWETDYSVGWCFGGWAFRDMLSGEEGFVEAAPGNRKLAWRVYFGTGDSQRSLCVKDGGAAPGLPATPGMFSPRWNIVRITVRGNPRPVITVGGGAFAPGLSMKVR